MTRATRTRPLQSQGQPDRETGHLEDCWDEPSPTGDLPRSEVEALQGAWVTIAGRREAEFLVCGQQIAVHFADGDIYMGTFELGMTTCPHTMDVRITAGPVHHVGQTARCIYELDGDTVRWCTAGPGVKDRLTRIPSADESPYLSLVLRRERRPVTAHR